MTAEPEETLYIVYLDDTQNALAANNDAGLCRLDDGLFLVSTDQTRSQLYHAVKRRCQPEKLLVAALDGEPKFKGMYEGALKWLRSA